MRVCTIASIEVSSGVVIRIWEGLCMIRQSAESLRLHWQRKSDAKRVLAMPVLNKSLERVLERASEGFLIDYKSDAGARFYTVRISPCHDIVKGGMEGIPWYTSFSGRVRASRVECPHFVRVRASSRITKSHSIEPHTERATSLTRVSFFTMSWVNVVDIRVPQME